VSGRFKSFLIFCFFLSFSINSFAEIKGSETVVSVQPYYDFPAADNDNTMLGFGWFKNGFGLEDNTTTCTFNCVYPVSGTIDFNGGSLYLAQDLIFQNETTFVDLGHVYGQGYSIQLCSSVTSLAATYTLHDTTVYLGTDVDIGGFVTIDGDCTLRGNGFHMNFLETTTLLIEANSTYILENVELRNVKGTCFKFADDSSKLILRHVRWVQSGDFTIDKGSILFDDEVYFAGAHNFYYESTQTSTIDRSSRWTVGGGMTLHAGRSESGAAVEPFYFVDDTSVLAFDTSSFSVTEYGIGLKKGTFELDREVYIDVASTTTTDGLIIGTGQEADDFSITLNSGAAVHLNSGCWIYNNYNSSGKLHALSETSRCLRYGNSKFYIMRDWIIPSMVFKVVSGNPESVLCDGVTFRYDKTHLANSMAEFEIMGQELSPGFKLAGDDYLYMTKGSLPIPIYVSGSGNKLYGAGDIEAVVTLQDLNTTVSCQLAGGFTQNIVLNGGKFVLEKDLDLEPDTIFSGSGTVYLSNHRIDFGAKDDTWDSEVFWNGDGGSLQLAADVDLCGTWTFDGSCIISGEGHVLTFSTNGKIVVTEGSSLTLRNMTVQGISQDSIICIDDDGQIILDKVSWVQSDHMTFDAGSLLFNNSVDFNGSYTFVYDSAMTSTIDSHARWLITDGMKLQIGRKNGVEGDEPLYMVDGSSKLRLKNCTLIPTSSGICFTQGSFEIQGDVSIDGLATTSAAAIMFGNGVEDDDVLVRLESGASIKFKTGWFAYNNVGSDSFVAASDGAEIIRYGDSKLAIMQSWAFPSMTFKVHSGLPQTVIEDGATLTYANTHLVFPTAEFDLTGSLIGFAHFGLTGSNTLYMTKGSFLPYLSVSGSANNLMGTGDMSGLIMLQNSDAELVCSLNGSILQSILMNGGQVTLSNDLYLGPDVHFSGEGKVNIASYQCIFGPTDFVCSDTVEWNGNGGSILFRSNVDFSGQWTFKDSCIVDGKGHTLTLENGGNIVVDEGADLTIKDIVLHGISENTITLLGDTSRLILDGVYWAQSDDVTFSTGSINFLNRVDFEGDSNFTYDSAQTSTIASNGLWVVRDGLTCKIGRKESYTSAEPLYFEDNSSAIKLKNCSFLVTSSGITIKKGKIIIDGDVDIDSLATTTNGAFMLGSDQAGQDAQLKLESGASIKFKSGWLSYNNVSPDELVASSDNAQVIRYADSKLYIMTDWNFPNMTFKVYSGYPQTLIADGATLTYDNTHLVFPGVEFDLTGNLVGFAQFSLTGGDSLNLTKGSFLPYLFVSNATNYLLGTGDITGLIMLMGPTAELICCLNGSIQQSIVMNGGKITLSNDLHMGPGVHFSGEGSVDLSCYQVVLSSADMSCTDTVCWDGDGGGLTFRGSIDFSGTWTFKDTCVIDGQGHTLNLGCDGRVVIDQDSELTLKNIVLDGVCADSILCLADDSRLILDNVSWIQDENYTFSVGSLKFFNDVEFRGAYDFVYDSAQTSTIAQHATWCFRDQISLTLGRKESYIGPEPLYFANDTATLDLQDCSFITTASGMALTRGWIRLNGTVNVENLSTTTNGGLMLGNGQEGQDIEFRFEPGASVHLHSGWLLYNNMSATAASAASATARVIQYADSKSYTMRDWALPSMTLEVVSDLPLALIAPGVTLSFNDVRVKTVNAEFEITGSEISSGLYGLTGDDTLNLTKGNFEPYTYIASTGNRVIGTGDISGLMTFAGPGSEISYSASGLLLQSPALNGGKITLTGNMRLGPNVCLQGPGEIDLGGYRCYLGLTDYVWTDSLCWDGNGGSLELSSQLSLHATWTFKNSCVLEGNANLLNLNAIGQIVVDDGASLTLRDLNLQGISDYQIRCLSDDSTIILDNVTWEQDGTYTFTTGSIQVKNNSLMTGPTKFVYESTQTSTILSRSQLKFDAGFTFSYAPASTSKDLLEFEDETSKLLLKSATFHATTTGAELCCGRLLIKDSATLCSEVAVTDEGVVIDEGIAVGDGTGDMICEIYPSANLNVTGGSLVYKNKDADSWVMYDSRSALCLLSESKLVLEESMDLGDGVVKIGPEASVVESSGKSLVGPVLMIR